MEAGSAVNSSISMSRLFNGDWVFIRRDAANLNAMSGNLTLVGMSLVTGFWQSQLPRSAHLASNMQSKARNSGAHTATLFVQVDSPEATPCHVQAVAHSLQHTSEHWVDVSRLDDREMLDVKLLENVAGHC